MTDTTHHEGPKLAYLVSEYPAISHTFIRREVAALRQLGADVQTFSIRRPASVLSLEDRQELAETWYVLPAHAGELLRNHARALFARPGAYFRALLTAMRHRVAGARGALWACFHFAEAIHLAVELERRRIRHLHNHFSNSAANVGLLTATYLGIDWSLTLHGSADFDSATRPLLREKIARARFTACVSDYGRAQAMWVADPDDWPRIFISRCGIDLASLSSLHLTRSSHETLRILSVGRLSPEKAQLGLIDAFAQLVEGGVEAELSIIGDGPERQRIEQRISDYTLWDRCRLEGAASEQEVLDALTVTDLFVLPSFMEGIPVVLMEAMALGIPVVAPRLGGIPELVEDQRCGILFTPARWEELAEAMAVLADDPNRRHELGAAGRRKIEAEFDLKRIADVLWTRFRDVG